MKSPEISNSHCCQNGFSLIELVIVVSILGVISYFGLWLSFQSYEIYALDYEKETLATALSEARDKSVIEESYYGVYIADSGYIIFQGQSYDSNNKNSELMPRNLAVNIDSEKSLIFSPYETTYSTERINLSYGSYKSTVSIDQDGKISS